MPFHTLTFTFPLLTGDLPLRAEGIPNKIRVLGTRVERPSSWEIRDSSSRAKQRFLICLYSDTCFYPVERESDLGKELQSLQEKIALEYGDRRPYLKEACEFIRGKHMHIRCGC